MSKSYKDKLISFEVQPPTAAWNAISEELVTNKDLISTSFRLFDLEIAPPLNAWNEINTTLTSNSSIQKNPVIKRKMTLLSYIMAVAALSGAIVIGVLYFNNEESFKNKIPDSHSSGITYKKAQSEEPVAEALPSISEPEANEEIVETAPATTSKINRSYTENSRVLQNTIVKKSAFPGDELQIAIAAKPIRNANGVIIQNPEIINNQGSKYISITGPNGQQTKISSKFFHVLLFINDDSDIDKVEGYFDKNFLESLIWKSRFQDWRNEIINTSFVPSSTNFMDILDFKDLIMKDRP